MSTRNAKVTEQACKVGHTTVRLQAMYHDAGYGTPSIAIEFGMGRATGLSVGFHGSTGEIREFAQQLLDHCDAADRAHMASASADLMEG